MDRNSAIGLTLIGLLLLVYFYWFAPKPEPPVNKEEIVAAEEIQPVDSLAAPAAETVGVLDSALYETYGDISSFMKGEEKDVNVETEDIKVTFTNKGGIIKFLELKKFRTYGGEPLVLIDPNSTEFSLSTQFNGNNIDLYDLYYDAATSKAGDTTLVTFSIRMADGAELQHIYKVPSTGYELPYTIKSRGIANNLSGQALLTWNNFLTPKEKSVPDSRNYTTITYYDDEGFDELSERSTSTEHEVLPAGLKWVSVKQKFFLLSLIADSSFAGGDVETSVNTSDESIVKRANIKLTLDTKDFSTDAGYKFYLGPNNYYMIGDVAPDFDKNVYLGWKPVYWINKFVIFPLFNFLTNSIGSFGLIIIIMVIAIRIVLLPLSYRSYLSMAKMKVLKPELDEIKEKFPDDMQKQQQEQLKLYQQVGVNPISGCIPLVLQMPILFSMFYLFPNSIQLRQETFLWAEDLSTYDSIVNLPFAIPMYGDHVSLFTLLMTISTLVITWQNNQVSNVQGPMKSMGYIMPIIFLFVLNSFPSGLSFYYLVSNLITFGQQAIIKKFVDEEKIKKIMEEHRKMISSGGGKKSKFMSRLQDAMKASEEARRNADSERKRKKN